MTRFREGYFANLALPDVASDFDVIFAKFSVHLKGRIRTNRILGEAANLEEAEKFRLGQKYDRRRGYVSLHLFTVKLIAYMPNRPLLTEQPPYLLTRTLWFMKY